MSEQQVAPEAKTHVNELATIQQQVQRLVALADAARASQNPLDLDSVRQELGANAMLDQAISMLEGFVKGDLDNATVQNNLTVLLAQQRLIDEARAKEMITTGQADQLSTAAKDMLAKPAEVASEAVVAAPVQDPFAQTREQIAAIPTAEPQREVVHTDKVPAPAEGYVAAAAEQKEKAAAAVAAR